MKKYTKEEPLKVFTAFSGYDSQCLALKRLGLDFDLVGWSEIDTNAIKAHNALFPEYKDRNYGDISKIDWKEVPDFELFTYSSPCFVAGTLVMTKDGLKNIEDVIVGDEVLTHTHSYHKVTETMKNEYVGSMYEIYTNSGSVVCTSNHPFYVYNYRKNEYDWVEARDVVYKDNLQLCINDLNENQWKFEYIEGFKCYTQLEPIYVYNLEVETDHSYTANNYVCHNCTDFSNAGLQAGGEEGSGTRSSLLWECRKAIATKRPKYLMFENVKAVVSDKFIHLFKKWCRELEDYGYVNYYQVLNAKDYGVPQNRERIFMISILRTEDEPDPYYEFPRPVPLKKTVSDVLEDNVDDKYYMSQEATNKYVERMKTEYPDNSIEKEEPLW